MPHKHQKNFSPFSCNKVFGSLGKAFDHKWEGIGYAHPHSKDDAQKAIHWARLAASKNPANVTYIIHPDTNWYQNPSPHTGPFPDTHIISIFEADTIIYTEPTKPPKPQTTNKEEKPRKEPSTLQLLCIHHQNNDIGTQITLDQLTQIAKILNIKQIYTKSAPPTPLPITVNNKTQWKKTKYLPSSQTQLHKSTALPDLHHITPL